MSQRTKLALVGLGLIGFGALTLSLTAGRALNWKEGTKIHRGKLRECGADRRVDLCARRRTGRGCPAAAPRHLMTRHHSTFFVGVALASVTGKQ